MKNLTVASVVLFAFVSTGMSSKKPKLPPEQLAESLVQDLPVAAFDLSQQVEGFRRDFGEGIPSASKSHFDAQVEELAEAPKHRERIKARYLADFTPEELQSLVDLKTPAYKKSIEASKGALESLQKDPAAYQKLVQEHAKTPLPSSRQKLFEELVDASPMRKGLAEGQKQTTAKLKEASNSKLDLSKFQDQMTDAMYEVFRKTAIQSSAYLYRNLSDSELREIIRSMKNPLHAREAEILPDARNDLLHELKKLQDQLRFSRK